MGMRARLLLVGAAVLLGPRLLWAGVRATNREDRAADLSAVRNADSVLLFEGLPHQLFEKDVLARELRSKAEQDGPFVPGNRLRPHVSSVMLRHRKKLRLIEPAPAL